MDLNAKNEFDLVAITNLQPLLTLPLFESYLKTSPNDPMHQITNINLIRPYLEAVWGTFGTGTPTKMFTDKVLQLLGVKVKTSTMSFGIGNAIDASVKFPTLKNIPKAESTSDINALIAANLNKHSHIIAEAQTKVFTFTPGSESANYDKPLVSSVIRHLVTLENFLHQRANENNLNFEPYLRTNMSKNKVQ